MSADSEAVDDVCASCGITGGDDIKLMKCTACKLVRYCSIDCQKSHRSQHKRACKQKAAQLRDEMIMFKQPASSHLGDCPICFLPMPLDKQKGAILPCCSKTICGGCMYASYLQQREDVSGPKCFFCRHPLQLDAKDKQTLDRDEDLDRLKRIEAGDPVAMREMGNGFVMKGNHTRALEYWTKAAGLGDIEAHYQLSIMYGQGRGVDKDKKKEMYHLEEAAIGGDYSARLDLGKEEWINGRFERAMKHTIIAANLGYDKSMKYLRIGYEQGILSKEDFAAALRGYQVALDAMKSPQREAAEELRRRANSNEAIQRWTGTR